ncbi:uncharacterized protein LOC131671556, partial [Phymastichus coffea]|uniref:uncharacterized protein LOC131671556 n=1 Tax=Phymastichus coffea TaxID=108790 RepID=UPI00273CD1CF
MSRPAAAAGRQLGAAVSSSSSTTTTATATATTTNSNGRAFGGGVCWHRYRYWHRWLIPLLLLLLLLLAGLVGLAGASRQSCPGCPHAARQALRPDPDEIRLEAIKHQILSKLGLKARPDVNRTLASVPKRLALETIYRAEAQPALQPQQVRAHSYHERQRYHNAVKDYERNRLGAGDEYGFGGGGGVDDYSYRNNQRTSDDGNTQDGQNRVPPYQEYDDLYGAPPPEPEVMDDFYARTSEIITFAEP